MKNWKKYSRIFAGFLATVLLTTGEWQIKPVQAAEVPEKKTEITEESMQEFLDSYFSENMEKYHVPGVAVSVVKDDVELLHAAYGVSDKENNVAVDAKETLFPACSVSKLFTATAIMQLKEQGKLDLNQDVTAYANDIKIENPYKREITCRDLLTHTSGLDEQSELFGSTLYPEELASQKTYFKTHVPTVIREPGTTSCYSNMGYNLLGYIVEKQSNQTYEDYVTEHLLKPLQMHTASVRIPSGEMASGYAYDGKDYEKQPFAYQYTSGSSGVIASVIDMENFMRMQLNAGMLGDTRILMDETVAEMQKRQFANQEVFEGMGYGFVRDRVNGVLVLKHEGALPGYATTMLLLPDEQMGIYVATNSLSGICFEFEEAFFDYFYEKQEVLDKQSKESKQDEDFYVGTYRSYDGIAKTNLMRIGILLETSDLKISKNENGQLKLEGYNQKKEKAETLLLPYEEDVFLREDGKGYVAFARDKDGQKVTYAYTNVSHASFERIGGLEQKGVLMMGFFLSLLMTGVASIFWLIQIKKEKVFCNKVTSAATGIGAILSSVGSICGILVAMSMILSYDYSKKWLMHLLLGLGNIASVAVACLEIGMAVRCKGKKRVIAVVFFLFQMLWIWNLYYFHI